MVIASPDTLAIFRRATVCELCFAKCRGGCDPFHIIAKGLGGGHRLDIRINLLSSCRECHTRHHNGDLLFDGQLWRRGQLFEVVAHREKISLDVDLEAVCWWLLRLPKWAYKTAIKRRLDELGKAERRIAFTIWEKHHGLGC